MIRGSAGFPICGLRPKADKEKITQAQRDCGEKPHIAQIKWHKECKY
jgi:hypothetical protein